MRFMCACVHVRVRVRVHVRVRVCVRVCVYMCVDVSVYMRVDISWQESLCASQVSCINTSALQTACYSLGESFLTVHSIRPIRFYTHSFTQVYTRVYMCVDI